MTTQFATHIAYLAGQLESFDIAVDPALRVEFRADGSGTSGMFYAKTSNYRVIGRSCTAGDMGEVRARFLGQLRSALFPATIPAEPIPAVDARGKYYGVESTEGRLLEELAYLGNSTLPIDGDGWDSVLCRIRQICRHFRRETPGAVLASFNLYDRGL